MVLPVPAFMTEQDLSVVPEVTSTPVMAILHVIVYVGAVRKVY